MSDDIESAQIQVFGADPRHAEFEARELRAVLSRLDDVQVHFAPPEAPQSTPGAKGAELLTPEVVLILTTGALGLAKTAIRAWAEVRKSRRVRLVRSDGSVIEFRGGVSTREVKELQVDELGTGPGGEE